MTNADHICEGHVTESRPANTSVDVYRDESAPPIETRDLRAMFGVNTIVCICCNQKQP